MVVTVLVTNDNVITTVAVSLADKLILLDVLRAALSTIDTQLPWYDWEVRDERNRLLETLRPLSDFEFGSGERLHVQLAADLGDHSAKTTQAIQSGHRTR